MFLYYNLFANIPNYFKKLILPNRGRQLKSLKCFNIIKVSIKIADKEIIKKQYKNGEVVIMKKFESHNIKVEDVADYFLLKINEDCEERITKLKLQKLLYYAQGFTMALTKKTLFKNEILAWQHGPVIQQIYDKYSKIDGNEIPRPDIKNVKSINKNKEIKEVIDEVYEVYGQFSAWKLRNMTHDEKPWLETAPWQPIKNSLMFDFFKTRVVS